MVHRGNKNADPPDGLHLIIVSLLESPLYIRISSVVVYVGGIWCVSVLGAILWLMNTADDSRAKLITAGVPGWLINLLNRGDKDLRRTCLNLLSELAKYGAFLLLA